MSERAGVVLAAGVLGLLAASGRAQMRFEDVSASVGLESLNAARVLLADVNGDGRPDAVIDRRRVFLNTVDADASLGWRFVEVAGTGLPTPMGGDLCVFADVDGDGALDAVFVPYLDVNGEGYEAPRDRPGRAAWLKGNGDGTFGEPVGSWREIESATPATSAAIAVGDADRDGRLDLYIGNWYERYGASLAGFEDELLLQTGAGVWTKQALRRDALDGSADAEGGDAGGRPTYGVMIADLLTGTAGAHAFAYPQLLELSYGRRWNRLWVRLNAEDYRVMIAAVMRRMGAQDAEVADADVPPGDATWAPTGNASAFAGDAIRHGRYPEWLKERARQDPRFERADEEPFRANGNTFDAAVGDIDGDGDFDVFLAEITHGWAGESSDRSQFLLNEPGGDGIAEFVRADAETRPGLVVDRVPGDATIRGWNQGDLYAELADLDHDGRLDLILCSSDYPDDQRLRIWRQQADGSLVDATPWVGIDHVGAQQPSLADLDGDGDLDLLVGQSFNRLSESQIAGRTPRVRVFLNMTAQRGLGNAIVLKLEGDPGLGVNRDGLGAIVRARVEMDGKQRVISRQVVGIGGHAGKQQGFAVHLGIGSAERAESIEIVWPDAARTVQRLGAVGAGTHRVRFGEPLE